MRHDDLDPALNDVSRRVLDASLRLHRAWGPGLLEGAYERGLAHLLERDGLRVARQVVQPALIEGVRVPAAYRIDLLVEGVVVVEVKAVPELHPVHFAQLTTYIRLGGFPLGLLLNFDAVPLKNGMRRVANTRTGPQWS